MSCTDKFLQLAAAGVLMIRAGPDSTLGVVCWLTQHLAAIFLIAATLDQLTAKLPPSIVQVEGEQQRIWARAAYGFTGQTEPPLRMQLMSICPADRTGSKATVIPQSTMHSGFLPLTRELCTCMCRCCHEDFQEGCTLAVLPCSHVFCEDCIAKWSLSGHAMSANCPLCRASFAKNPEQLFSW